MKINGFKLGSVILIIIITSIMSAITTGVIITNNYETSSGLTFGEILYDENLSEFLNIYSQIKDNFYGDYDEIGMISAASDALFNYSGTSSSEAIEVAIDAMLSYLPDDYTTFLTDDEYDYLSDELSGTYEGIGITINGNEVISVTKDSPADTAGILVGDIITIVNGETITSDNSYFISYIISSSDSDLIELTISRGYEEISFVVYKATLDSSTKYYMIADTNVGYISLSVFSSDCSSSFENALLDLESMGMDSLIIDLRSNGGGYLTEAVDIAELFLTKDSVVNSLVSNDGKIYNYDETDEYRDCDIIILVNGETASASEILAAALVDNGVAEIVGTQTYGKGTVQQLIETTNGTTAKYTTAYWYTPNEICINNMGITPTYYVEIEYITDEEGDYIGAVDSQYNKALEILKGE